MYYVFFGYDFGMKSLQTKTISLYIILRKTKQFIYKYLYRLS